MLSSFFKALDGFARLLSGEAVVVTSEPIRQGNKWGIIRGDLISYKFEEHSSQSDAARAMKSIAHSADIQGTSNEITVRVIVLKEEVVSKITDQESYKKVAYQQYAKAVGQGSWPPPF